MARPRPPRLATPDVPFRVERLGHDGDGLVTTPGGPVFVRGALPGDLVSLASLRKDRAILRADLARLVEPSSSRVEPACSIALRCGGCTLMSLAPPAELDEKRALVERAFSAAGLPIAVEIVAPPPDLGYRVRARLAFDAQGRALGYRAAGTKELVDVERCVVLESRLGDALGTLRTTLLPLLSGRGEIHLGLGRRGAVLGLESADPQLPSVFAALAALVERGAVGGAAIRAGGTSVRTTWGEAAEEAHDVDGRALEVPLAGFRQAHEAASAELARTVLEWSGVTGGRTNVLELFAGHGNFTLPLAARAGSLVAVESDPDAASALRRNLRAHGLSADVVESDAARAIEKKRPRGSVDVIVLDPPRAGASDCVAGIAALAPTDVVYVSCDPRTLARDVALLVKAGFDLQAVRAVNCFPRTASIEAVAKLVRDGSRRRGG